MNDKTNTVGEACGFVRYDGPKEEFNRIAGGIIDSMRVEEILSSLYSEPVNVASCDSSKLPYPLKLSLDVCDEDLEYKDDPALTALARKAYDAKLNWAIKATYVGEPVEAVEALEDVLGQIGSSHLYKPEEDFFGKIICKDIEGKYVFVD